MQAADASYLDPHARSLLTRLAGDPSPDAGRDVVGARAWEKRLHAALNPPAVPVARVEEVAVPGDAGPVCCLLLGPSDGGPLPLTIYLHGGGCVLLEPKDYVPLCSYVAVRARTLVIAPAYRLAPEAPFPAAIDDAVAVYRWALEHAGDVGADARRIALCGDSAGGYLATAVTLAARDAGLPQPRCQVLAYPNTDMAGDWPSYHQPELVPMRARMATLARLYVGEHAADPRASPLLADNHGGLAPTLIMAAGFDALVDQGRAYAEKLSESGVEVTYSVYRGLPHGFLSMAGALPAVRVARAQLAAALRHWLGDAP